MDNIPAMEKNPTIAVAVSGGSDSMALVYLADQWAKENGGSVVALTVDHRLRSESTEEARSVGVMLANASIPHHILTWETEKPSSNIQAAAREVRYALMEDWCRMHHVLHLLVAQHADDQAETLLIRLERGSGLDGLSAMPLISCYKSVRLIRPLLSFSKQSLQDYLKANDKTWVEDPSNQKSHYTRNRIRQALAVEDEQLVSRLSMTAMHLGMARHSMDHMIAAALAKIVNVFPEGYALLDLAGYKMLQQEIAYHVLADVLCLISGQIYKPRFDSLTLLYQQLTQQSFAGQTLWGCEFIAYRDKILIYREKSAIKADISIVPGEASIWDSRFFVEIAACYREKQLTIGRFTEEDRRIIKKNQPLLFPSTLPKRIIATLPVIKTLDSILSIPHIRYYRDDEAKQNVRCHFKPPQPLKGAPFYNIGLQHRKL